MVPRATEPGDWQERPMTVAELRDWKPDPAYADRCIARQIYAPKALP